MKEYVISLLAPLLPSMRKNVRLHLYQAENANTKAEQCKGEPIERYKWISGSHLKDANDHLAKAKLIQSNIDEIEMAIEILGAS